MRIYVGNLPREATEDDLQDAFAAFGQVTSVAVIKDKFSGQSRGFGFVEMGNSEEGDKAIAGLNGSQVGGRTINVNEARPKTERAGEGRGGDRGDRGGRRR